MHRFIYPERLQTSMQTHSTLVDKICTLQAAYIRWQRTTPSDMHPQQSELYKEGIKVIIEQSENILIKKAKRGTYMPNLVGKTIDEYLQSRDEKQFKSLSEIFPIQATLLLIKEIDTQALTKKIDTTEKRKIIVYRLKEEFSVPEEKQLTYKTVVDSLNRTMEQARMLNEQIRTIYPRRSRRK